MHIDHTRIYVYPGMSGGSVPWRQSNGDDGDAHLDILRAPLASVSTPSAFVGEGISLYHSPMNRIVEERRGRRSKSDGNYIAKG